MLKLLRQGRLSKWFSGIGQEAIAVGVTAALEDGLDSPDAPQPRGVHRPGTGLAAADAAAAAARGGFHQGARPHLPLRHARAPHRRHDQPPRRDAAGGRRRGARRPAAGRARRRRRLHRRRIDLRRRLPRGGEPRRGLEAARPLRHREQPVRALDAHQRAVRLPRPRRQGAGYGMPGVIVDGNDVLAVFEAVRARPAARARRGEGPTLLEFKTFRMRGHEEASGTDYVPAELFEEWARKDPIARLERLLDERGLLPADERSALRARSSRESTTWPTRRWRHRCRESTAERRVGRRLRAERLRARGASPGGA